jgi:Leucine-rich repeat (LRR) protein
MVKQGPRFIVDSTDHGIAAFPHNREKVSDRGLYKALADNGDLGPVRETIYSLDLAGCNLIAVLPDLRTLNHLEKLNLNDCEEFVRFSALPASLQFLNLGHCKSLERITPGMLPASLQCLFCNNCKNLVELPNLSEFTRLKHLDLSYCKNLRKLPALPISLEVLLLGEDSQLSELPDLRVMCPSLRQLDVSNTSLARVIKCNPIAFNSRDVITIIDELDINGKIIAPEDYYRRSE